MGFRDTLRSFFIGQNLNDGPSAPVTRVDTIGPGRQSADIEIAEEA